MSYLSPAIRAEIEAEITRKKAQLELANTTYERLLTKDIEEYRFDSNEGSQRARRVKLSEMRAQIEALEAEIARLQRKLYQGGLTSVVLRRQ